MHDDFDYLASIYENGLDYSHENFENPVHSGPLRRLIELIGNGLSRLSQPFSKPPFREGIDQEAKHHDHAERFDSLLFLEVDFRDMKALILQESKSAFHRLLPFIIIEHELWFQISLVAGQYKSAELLAFLA
jgi:hypothetical protein